MRRDPASGPCGPGGERTGAEPPCPRRVALPSRLRHPERRPWTLLLALLLALPATAQDAYRPFPTPDALSADAPWPPPKLPALPGPLGLGRTPAPEAIAGWDIDVRADGQGLPAGSGTAREGEEPYITHCAACHGDFGEGLDRWPALAGWQGSLTTNNPRRTVGSYWSSAPVVFDYIRRAMPYAAPQSLTTDEYWAITAYVLFLNDLVGQDDRLDAASLPTVRMPNRDGFVLDPRPDTPDTACLQDCRSGEPARAVMDSRRFGPPGSASGTSTPP